ncbi:hypothetical protein KIH39_12235 [Telmatocola sphagniphila]|uniref:Uncharacterized protein n=1 Tax=Telmatocola sphagniphila TaxID=1123043 RepID=A0A8E6BCG6_9BACT|nr:hypothetical protein [Telmatocola sphagniphila]QVL34638.1 hypothetical protein KIH39_12235 [Telmatocola sphagniphila]
MRKLALVVFMGLGLGNCRAEDPRLQATQIEARFEDAQSISQAIEKQTKVRIGGILTPMPVNGAATNSKETFWNAIERLGHLTNSVIEIPVNGLDWRLTSHQLKTPKLSVDGPFRVELRDVRAESDFRTGEKKTSFQFQLAWEPRFSVCRCDVQPQISEFMDDLKNKYQPRENRVRTASRGNFATLVLPIYSIPRTSHSITALEGKVNITLCPELKTEKFQELQKSRTLEQAESVVEFQGLKKDGRFWSATITTRYKATNFAEFESFERDRFAYHSASLISPEGKRFPARGFEEADGRFVYRFEEDEKKGLKINSLLGWSLEYKYPGTWIEVPVKFKFQKIELP